MDRPLRKRLFQALMAAAVASNLFYLSYRIGFTLNYDAMAFSVLFLLAEVHGALSLFLFFFDVWSPAGRRNPPPVNPRFTVDVFIPTYNEELAILHRTILAARDIAYPHETYVLDDGNRPEVRELAERLGVHYISRPDRKHAKAGNINHALSRTRGELIAVFDADHVPQPNFLHRTVGYFDDERVGFVQTPHGFYNFGSFQTFADFRQRKYWDDQELFFRVVQPGKDRWGAAFFCGSCGVIRRRCLEEVGGFDYRTITEDMHTSLRIHARGWKSIYHDELLATGLSPGDLGAYWKQRMRWAVGNLSVMWHDNPLLKRGLTLAQRLSYFGSVWAWTVGLQKVIYYFTPPFMLLTGLYPIAHFDLKLLGIYGGNLLFSLLVFKMVSRGHGKILRGELFSMVNTFMLLMAMVRALFGMGTRRFVVTKKAGRSEHVLVYVMPQVLLVVATYWCGLWALLRYSYGMAMNMVLTAVAAWWSGYNAVLALIAVGIAHTRIDIRKKFRFRHRLPVSYQVEVPEGPPLRGMGTSLDLNDGGLALRAFERLPLGMDVALVIHLLDGGRVRCRGRILYRRAADEGRKVWDYGVVLTDLPPDERAALDRYFIRYVIPAVFRFLTRRSPAWRRRLARWFAPRLQRRAARRKGVQFPLAFDLDASPGEGAWYITDDLSERGMGVVLPHRQTVGQETRFTLLLPGRRIVGRALFVREEPIPLPHSEFYRYGLAFLDLPEPDRARIRALGRFALEEEATT